MLDSRHFVIRTLLADGLIQEPDVRRATEHAMTKGGDLFDSLVALGVVSSRRLAIAKAKICEYPFVDLAHFDIDIRNTRYMPRGVSERLTAFPLFCVDGVATVAMLDPLNLQAIDQVRQLLKMEVDPVLADTEQLKALIARAYSLTRTDAGGAVGESEDEVLTTGEEPIVAAVNQIIAGAADAGASDIHINPDELDLHLRYRIDGVLQSQQGPQRSAHTSIVQRLKVLAKLDMTQTRRPQDGKFRFIHKGQPVDIRLSLVPTIHGENVVMRLLATSTKIGHVTSLGMPERMTAWYGEAISRPHGMVLVTGPTGSGKTTTLYTALNHLNSPDLNIMTIEDPVEIRLPLVRQIQTNSEIGLTFAATLRSVLRQDPDVVLVGEIRDQETAKIAVQAAMTGHLVFSTLHTNDAIGAIARLKHFDIPAFAINSALLCTIAQRLVRRICESCAVAEDDAKLLADVPTQYRPAAFRKAVGCGACKNAGYRGRLGVFEMLRMTHMVQRLIELDSTRHEIRAVASREGMSEMWDDGVEKASRALTTLSEVSRLRSLVEEADPESRLAA